MCDYVCIIIFCIIIIIIFYWMPDNIVWYMYHLLYTGFTSAVQ